MRPMTYGVCAMLVVTLGGGVASAQTAATTPSPLTTVLSASDTTPDGTGLLTTALGQARAALAAAVAAAAMPTDLDGLRRQMGLVRLAIDPTIDTKAEYGGLRQTVQEMTVQLDQLAAEEKKPDAARVLPRARSACANVATWIEALLAATGRVSEASSPEAAAAALPAVTQLARQLIAGVDRDGEGRVTAVRGAEGLQAIQRSLGVLAAGRDRAVPAIVKGSTTLADLAGTTAVTR